MPAKSDIVLTKLKVTGVKKTPEQATIAKRGR